jgi:hypothetical protein
LVGENLRDRCKFNRSRGHHKRKNLCDEKVTKLVIFMACSQGGWHRAKPDSDSFQRVSNERFKAEKRPFESDC